MAFRLKSLTAVATERKVNPGIVSVVIKHIAAGLPVAEIKRQLGEGVAGTFYALLVKERLGIRFSTGDKLSPPRESIIEKQIHQDFFNGTDIVKSILDVDSLIFLHTDFCDDFDDLDL